MKIIRIQYRRRKQRYSYVVVNDDGKDIANLDTLTEAALVVRYLSGAGMPDNDAAQALKILKAVDQKLTPGEE